MKKIMILLLVMRMIIISMILQTPNIENEDYRYNQETDDQNESNGIAVDNEQHQSAPNEQNSDSNDEETVTKKKNEKVK